MTEQGPEETNNTVENREPHARHVCPVWIGRLLTSPLRRLVENPMTILGPLVTPGATVIDVGCAMGFHTLDLARLVGPEGHVVCVDIQQKMLDGLMKRARRKGLDGNLEPRLCTQQSLGIGDLAGGVKLVTLFNVVHETPYPERFIAECAKTLQPRGRLLIVEPRGHVTDDQFSATTATAAAAGLSRESSPAIWRSHTALFVKPGV